MTAAGCQHQLMEVRTDDHDQAALLPRDSPRRTEGYPGFVTAGAQGVAAARHQFAGDREGRRLPSARMIAAHDAATP